MNAVSGVLMSSRHDYMNNLGYHLRQGKVSSCAIAVYTTIQDAANSQKWPQTVVLSDTTIISFLSICAKTLRKAKAQLQELGLIKVWSGGKGRGVKTKYQLLTSKETAEELKKQPMQPKQPKDSVMKPVSKGVKNITEQPASPIVVPAQPTSNVSEEKQKTTPKSPFSKEYIQKICKHYKIYSGAAKDMPLPPDGHKRNFTGMLNVLAQWGASEDEMRTVAMLSNFGAISTDTHTSEFWKLVDRVRSAPKSGPGKINNPVLLVLSCLRKMYPFLE